MTKLGVQKVSNADYHSGPGLSSSDLKKILKSAAHFKASKENPEAPSNEMLFGSLVDTMILEPELLDAEFAIGEFNIRRGKKYDKVVNDNPSKIVMSLAEFQ